MAEAKCQTCAEVIEQSEPAEPVAMKHGRPRYRHTRWQDCSRALSGERYVDHGISWTEDLDPVEMMGPC